MRNRAEKLSSGFLQRPCGHALPRTIVSTGIIARAFPAKRKVCLKHAETWRFKHRVLNNRPFQVESASTYIAQHKQQPAFGPEIDSSSKKSKVPGNLGGGLDSGLALSRAIVSVYVRKEDEACGSGPKFGGKNCRK